MNKKKLKSLLVIGLLFSSLLMVLLPSSTASIPSGWTYYKTMTVSNGVAGYEMFVNVSNASGLINCSGHCQPDFDDIIFTDIDDNTTLYHWKEFYVTDQFAWFWVKLPADIVADGAINLVYGNASATDYLSDGSATFYFFEGFDSNPFAYMSNTTSSNEHHYSFFNFSIPIDKNARMRTMQTMDYFYHTGDDGGAFKIALDSVNDTTSSEVDFIGYETRPAGLSDFSPNVRAQCAQSSTPTYDGTFANLTNASTHILDLTLNSSVIYNLTSYDTANGTEMGDLSVITNIPAGTVLDNITFRVDVAAGANYDVYYDSTNKSFGVKLVENSFIKKERIDSIFVSNFTGDPDTEPAGTALGPERAPLGPSGYVCSPVTPDKGSWAFSEAVTNGTMDDLWHEDDWAQWQIYDASAFWSENRTYSFYRENGVAGLNATLLNTSGMNRFQSVMWIHNNDTRGENANTTQGFYIEGCGGNWTYFGFGPSAIYAIAYNGTTEYDIESKKPINLTDAEFTNVTNHYTTATPGVSESGGEAVPYYWEITPWDNNGSWVKLIYDDNCQCIKIKCWGDPTMVGLMNEPAGWAWEYCEVEKDFFNCSTPCVGIATWDPSGGTNRSDFDIINFFNENYSFNGSHKPPEYPLGQPFMEFLQLNASTWKTNFSMFYNESEAGNLSAETTIPYLRTFTDATMKNSRPFFPNDTALDLEPWEQNDTVRYHSWVFYNSTEIGPAWVYNSYLILYIHETTNGYGPSSAGDPYSCVAINVDGDDSWDPNDRLWYMDTSGIRWQFNGNNSVPWFINGTIYQTNQGAYQNLYRYNNHTHSIFAIPLAELIKDDGYPLNESDMFNISIFTGNPSFTNINFWQNWNESACTPYYGGADEDHDLMKNYFLNTTYIDNTTPLTINGSNIARWGLGQITGGVTLGPEYVYSATVTKESNVTSVTGQHLYYPVRYYINITNTGTGTLTDIYINETLYNCSCGDYKMTYVGGNQDLASNITFYNDSCYMIIHNVSIEPLGAGNTWSVWFDVNVSNCTGDYLDVVTNNVTVNATELTGDLTDTVTINFGAYLTGIRYTYTTGMADMNRIGNSVFGILGILFIIGSILLIVGVAMKFS